MSDELGNWAVMRAGMDNAELLREVGRLRWQLGTAEATLRGITDRYEDGHVVDDFDLHILRLAIGTPDGQLPVSAGLGDTQHDR